MFTAGRAKCEALYTAMRTSKRKVTRVRRMWGHQAIDFADANGSTVCRFPNKRRPRAEGLTPKEARNLIEEGAWPSEFYADLEVYETPTS
jgi:hypothetical protein